MKHLVRSLLALVLALTLLASTSVLASAEGGKSVTVGVTSPITTLNPLLCDATEIVKYATSLVFLPLVEMTADNVFVPQLAQSITTEDNTHFTITLQQDAKWSDGTPVTARDVEFTFLLLTSPECLYNWLNQNAIVGTDDYGYAPQDATSLEGVQVVDDKTLTITTKWPVSLYTFENIVGRYMFPLPEHVLGNVPRDQLLNDEWFRKPTVVSGPFFVEDYDANHYVNYVANENYFQGAPKIDRLNLKV
ncbi:MAG: ABC transporter substrate-binding protein, partial [Eubacteriales bacterium]|nr:ABC transporter substrate-binding protein [Eubacteriales bacterium]